MPRRADCETYRPTMVCAIVAEAAILSRTKEGLGVMAPGSNGRQLAANWLITNVAVGSVFHWNDLKNAFPQISQIDRRGRELRTHHGWGISTNRDDPSLARDEARLDSIGTMP